MKFASKLFRVAFLTSAIGSLAGCAYNTAQHETAPVLSEIFNKVVSHHVSSPAPASLKGNKTIEELLGSLDAHSRYLPPERFRRIREEQFKGRFGGVGIEVTEDTNSPFVRVVTPIDDTPAARGGIRPGDIITHLNGRSLKNAPLEAVIALMRGVPGTPVTLTVQHKDGTGPQMITLTRDTIKVTTVKSAVIGDDVGYIRITAFSDNTENNLFYAIDQLKADLGNRARGYIIDLRNNPGGLLLQAIDVADDFLDSGQIVSVGKGPRHDNGKSSGRETYIAYHGDITNRKPIIILINEGSASAAEILAGALQDHGRAIILGTQSFGKGSVQTIFPLSNGGALALTTAHYFTPSGDSIQGRGITPDIEYIAAGSRNQSYKREADYKNALANPGTESDGRRATQTCTQSLFLPLAQPDPNTLTIDGTPDFQLLCAVEKLRGNSVYTRLTTIATPRPRH